MKSCLPCWSISVVAVGWFLHGCPAHADDAGLATKAQAILKTHCHRCHGKDGAAKGGFNYVLDRDLLLARNKVIAGNPADSELLRRAKKGEMPPPNQKPRPDAPIWPSSNSGSWQALPRFPAPRFRQRRLRKPISHA